LFAPSGCVLYLTEETEELVSQSCRRALFVLSLALLLVSSALAGPVTFGDGNIVVIYLGGGDDSASFDVTAPGAKEETFDGTYVISPDFSTTRGHSGANYDIADLSDGASFDVSIFHSNKGTEGGTTGGSVDFALAFTTDRPLHYVFGINPAGATHFQANLDDAEEFLDIDVFGNASGSLINDGELTPKTLEGTLPAGAHTVSLSLDVDNGRTDGGGATEGSFTLALTDEGNGGGGGSPIPLPAGGSAGLLTLAVIMASAKLQRLCRG
jgi:hypothetical protein